MKVGFLHSILREEEKLLIDEFRSRPGVEVVKIDDRERVFNLHKNDFDFDVVIERCINHSRAIHAIKIFEDFGIPTVNTYQVAEVCGSKFLTTQAIIKAGIPTPMLSWPLPLNRPLRPWMNWAIPASSSRIPVHGAG